MEEGVNAAGSWGGEAGVGKESGQAAAARAAALGPGGQQRDGAHVVLRSCGTQALACSIEGSGSRSAAGVISLVEAAFDGLGPGDAWRDVVVEHPCTEQGCSAASCPALLLLGCSAPPPPPSPAVQGEGEGISALLKT